jgi:hypothetical protein
MTTLIRGNLCPFSKDDVALTCSFWIQNKHVGQSVWLLHKNERDK